VPPKCINCVIICPFHLFAPCLLDKKIFMFWFLSKTSHEEKNFSSSWFIYLSGYFGLQRYTAWIRSFPTLPRKEFSNLASSPFSHNKFSILEDETPMPTPYSKVRTSDPKSYKGDRNSQTYSFRNLRGSDSREES